MLVEIEDYRREDIVSAFYYQLQVIQMDRVDKIDFTKELTANNIIRSVVNAPDLFPYHPSQVASMIVHYFEAAKSSLTNKTQFTITSFLTDLIIHFDLRMREYLLYRNKQNMAVKQSLSPGKRLFSFFFTR